MGWYGGFAPYVKVADRKRKAAKEVEKLKKKGQVCEPIIIEGRTIANTFWGKAWCKNLESYRLFKPITTWQNLCSQWISN